MPLPSSGPLTLAQIQTEFGGSDPISLSEYYAGGANVPAGTTGTYGAVPSSGAISIQNFYGTQKQIPVGETWYVRGSIAAPPEGTNQLACIGNAIFGTYLITIGVTFDYGQSWASYSTGATANTAAQRSTTPVCKVNNNQYLVNSGYGYYSSSSDGITWTRSQKWSTAAGYYGLNSDGNQKVVAVGSNGQYNYSTNGGVTWPGAAITGLAPSGSRNLNGVSYLPSVDRFIYSGGTNYMGYIQGASSTWVGSSFMRTLTSNQNGTIMSYAGNGIVLLNSSSTLYATKLISTSDGVTYVDRSSGISSIAPLSVYLAWMWLDDKWAFYAYGNTTQNSSGKIYTTTDFVTYVLRWDSGVVGQPAYSFLSSNFSITSSGKAVYPLTISPTYSSLYSPL